MSEKIMVYPHCANCQRKKDLQEDEFLYDSENNTIYCDSECVLQHIGIQEVCMMDAEWEEAQ